MKLSDLSRLFMSIACAAFFYTENAQAQDTALYACVPNEEGRTRLVSGPDDCRENETVIGLSSAPTLPAVEPIGFSTLQAKGNATGCDLIVWSNITRYQVVVDCNTESEVGQSDLSINADLAPDSAYQYDGLYICLNVDGDAIARDDGGGDNFGVLLSISPVEQDPTTGEFSVPNGGEVLASWNFDEIDYPFAQSGSGANCVTLKLEDASFIPFNSDPFYTFQNPSRAALLIFLPRLAPHTTARNDGDSVMIKEIGLTISGFAE